MYAVWRAEEYKITYLLRGGVNGENPEKYTVEDGKIQLKPATRTGYKFLSWSTTITGTEEVTAIDTSRAEDITLYARWEAETYTVTLNITEGNTEEITVTYGGVYSGLTVPERKGYTFEGWYTQAEGGTAVTTGTTVSETQNHELYARWKINEYRITYVLNGGANGENPTGYTVETENITLNAATRTGYKFTGWYESESGGEKVTAIDTSRAEDITLYARWEAETYTVTLNITEGNTEEITVTYGGVYSGLTVPERKGYTFEGWYTQAEGGTAVTTGTTVSETQNHELYARWKINEYRITYVLNGGANGENPTGYTVEDQSITLNAATRTGYKFTGWYESESGGEKVTAIDTLRAEDITLYARWEAETYTVSFVTNGGSGVDAQTVVSGGLAAFAKTERENYTFMGWYIDENMSEEYDFAQPVAENRVLYAKWRLAAITAVSENGIKISISSDAGFDDGSRIVFEEVDSEKTEQAAGALAGNMTIGRLYNIKLIDASGNAVVFEGPLSVRISLDGLGEAEGRYGVIYIPDDYNAEGTQEITSTVTGNEIHFYVEHFSYYAIVDILPVSAFAWWWILVAVGACVAIAVIIALIVKSRRTFELSYVNGGIVTRKMLESALVELPSPESDDKIFEGWYYDDMFTNRAFLTAMPRQNVILFAKWREMTDEEKRAKAESVVRAEIVSD